MYIVIYRQLPVLNITEPNLASADFYLGGIKMSMQDIVSRADLENHIISFHQTWHTDRFGGNHVPFDSL